MAKCAHTPELCSGSRFGTIVQWTRCRDCGEILAKPKPLRMKEAS